MKNTEIDHALALAIGWQENKMQFNMKGNVFLLREGLGGKYWRLFDHIDPAVIWPIAERFKAFPIDMPSGEYAAFQGDEAEFVGYHSNPATAPALAVIEHCKKGE